MRYGKPDATDDELWAALEVAQAADFVRAMPEGLQPSYVEVNRSAYRRTFTLSKELNADKVSAELSHGVLRVRIPKADHAQPRRIAIQVN